MEQTAFSFVRYGLVLIACSSLTWRVVAAQETALRGPDGGTSYRVAGIEVLPVTGKPFTAKDNIDWTGISRTGAR